MLELKKLKVQKTTNSRRGIGKLVPKLCNSTFTKRRNRSRRISKFEFKKSGKFTKVVENNKWNSASPVIVKVWNANMSKWKLFMRCHTSEDSDSTTIYTWFYKEFGA